MQSPTRIWPGLVCARPAWTIPKNWLASSSLLAKLGTNLKDMVHDFLWFCPCRRGCRCRCSFVTRPAPPPSPDHLHSQMKSNIPSCRTLYFSCLIFKRTIYDILYAIYELKCWLCGRRRNAFIYKLQERAGAGVRLNRCHSTGFTIQKSSLQLPERIAGIWF